MALALRQLYCGDEGHWRYSRLRGCVFWVVATLHQGVRLVARVVSVLAGDSSVASAGSSHFGVTAPYTLLEVAALFAAVTLLFTVAVKVCEPQYSALRIVRPIA
jgi:hypothetical protein